MLRLYTIIKSSLIIKRLAVVGIVLITIGAIIGINVDFPDPELKKRYKEFLILSKVANGLICIGGGVLFTVVWLLVF